MSIQYTCNDLQMFSPKFLANVNNFHPLEVVGRGSETQLQVGENLNKTTWGCMVNIPTSVECLVYVPHTYMYLCIFSGCIYTILKCTVTAR